MTLTPYFHQLAGNEFLNEGAEDELLVVIGDPGASPDQELEGLLAARTCLVLENSFSGAAAGLYVLRDNPKKCVVVVRFAAPLMISSFEARWLAHRLFVKIRELTHQRKTAVFLPGKVTPLQIVMAEDIFFYDCTPLYDAHTQESFRMIVPTGIQLPDSRDYAIRFEGQHAYRQWINENPDTLTSQEIGDRLQQFALDHHLEFTKMRTSRLEEERLNLIVAVGRASETSPPRLFTLMHNYRPGSKPLVLIGKGVTFDAGGINVKTADRLVDTMKNDMGGAALMSSLFMALVKTGYDGPLVLLVPACENVIGPDALRPGTVVKNRTGRSIVVENTDAEGRLLLADAISYAEEQFDPGLVMTAATLTTASLHQFSPYITPVYFAPQGFRENLRRHGVQWGEEFTFPRKFLPFQAANDTTAADLTNKGRLPKLALESSRSNIAAHFLQSFSRSPLIHLDIFCTTWNWAGDYPGARYGATGAVFNSMLAHLRQRDF